MPVMDGVELTKAIKEDYPQIEIIILSSFGSFDYVRSTFQLGISDYILKPQLEGADLLEALKQAAHKIPGVLLIEDSVGDEAMQIESIIDRVIAGYQLDEDYALIEDFFSHSHYCLLGIDNKGYTNQKKSKIPLMIEEIEGRFRNNFTHIEIHRLPTVQKHYSSLIQFPTKSITNH